MSDPYACAGQPHAFYSAGRRRTVWPSDPDYERSKGQPLPDGSPGRDLVIHRDGGDMSMEVVDYLYVDSDEEIEDVYDPFVHYEHDPDEVTDHDDPFALNPSDPAVPDPDPFSVTGNPIVKGRPTRRERER